MEKGKVGFWRFLWKVVFGGIGFILFGDVVKVFSSRLRRERLKDALRELQRKQRIFENAGSTFTTDHSREISEIKNEIQEASEEARNAATATIGLLSGIAGLLISILIP